MDGAGERWRRDGVEGDRGGILLEALYPVATADRNGQAQDRSVRATAASCTAHHCYRPIIRKNARPAAAATIGQIHLTWLLNFDAQLFEPRNKRKEAHLMRAR